MIDSETQIINKMDSLGARTENIYNTSLDTNLPFYYFNYNGTEYALATHFENNKLMNLALYEASALG
jgi:hypothetical protein